MFFNIDKQPPDVGDVKAAVAGVIDGGNFILGENVERFEDEWARYNLSPFCVGVGNGTDAIRIALLALGVGPGDEVISPAFNVSYTALAVEAIGATNVFVDVDPDTMLVGVDNVLPAVNSRTRAVLPVHLYGQMANMPELRAMCDQRGLLLVDDAAQAHGASFDGILPGQYSDAACFSFYPTKNLGAIGEAGALVTKHPHVAARAKSLRDGGRVDRYVNAIPGLNSTLDEVQAAVLLARLPHLREMNWRRRQLASAYLEGLAGLPMQFQRVAPEARHVWHLFVVRLIERDALQRHLEARGIPTLSHYPVPMHQQPFMATSRQRGSFWAAESSALTCLSLPLYPSLSHDDQDLVIQAVREFFA